MVNLAGYKAVTWDEFTGGHDPHSQREVHTFVIVEQFFSLHNEALLAATKLSWVADQLLAALLVDKAVLTRFLTAVTLIVRREWIILAKDACTRHMKVGDKRLVT